MSCYSNKIGIVILNFGCPDDTIALTRSLRSLDGDWDIVIVDNFSTSSVLEKLKSFIEKQDEKIHFISSPLNLGYGKGNNEGMSYAFNILKCDYSLVLNPDVTLEKEFSLSSLADYLSSDDEFIFTGVVSQNGVVSSVLEFNPLVFSSKRIEYISNEKERKFIPEYIPGCCWGMSKGMWKRAGGFSDKLFLYFEELDYIYRYKKISGVFPEIKIFPSISLSHKEGGSTGASQNSVLMSPFADYWSSRSRVEFCIEHLPYNILIAVFYNFIKLCLRASFLRIGNVKSIIMGTFDGFIKREK